MTSFVKEEAADKIMKDGKLLYLYSVNKAAPEQGYLYVSSRKNFGSHEITLEPGDKVILENTEMTRAMKGDSIATACDTSFESIKFSDETVRTKRNVPGLSD